MNQIKIGHYLQDGGLVYVPVGFVPDFVWAIDKNTASGSAVVYVWFREMEAHDTLDGWGFTDGVDAELAAAGGFAAYDSEAAAPTIREHAVSTAFTLLTTPATCYCKPPVDATDEDGAVIDRDAIFQCISAGNTSATAPTAWPAEIGGTLVDGTVTWERVNVATFRKGYQGFRVAGAIQNDGYEMYYVAIQGDGGSRDFGDAADWADGIYGS